MNADLRLYSLVLRRGPQGFAWGSRDCFIWACDAVQAVTGRDPGADLRQTYSTAAEALALLRRLGGLAALASDRIGRQVLLAEARDGDVALLARGLCGDEAAEHGALAVVWRGTLVGQGARGLLYPPMAAARSLWRPA